MRMLNAGIAALLLLLAVRESGNPDHAIWVIVFGIGAFWNVVAILRPRVLTLRPITMLLSMTMAAALLGLFYFWPKVPGWWQPALWDQSGVREGMGVIVFALAILAVIGASIRASRAAQAEASEARREAIERRRAVALGGGSLAEDV